ICYKTIKYSNTAILLSINSFFEILHQTGNFYHLIIALSGINYIQFGNAILFQSHTLIGYYCALFTFNSLSIDRIYSILNQQKYICGHLITIFILICFLIYIIIKTTINNSFKIVNGSIASISSVINQEFKFMPYFQFVTMTGIIFYFFIGLKLFFKKVNSVNNMNKKIYRSLLLIIFINIFCYILSIIIMKLFINPLTITDSLKLNLYTIIPSVAKL
ncbi:hypothetical protein Mgra_00007614, partial [Meloidogyne graminicola]